MVLYCDSFCPRATGFFFPFWNFSQGLENYVRYPQARPGGAAESRRCRWLLTIPGLFPTPHTKDELLTRPLANQSAETQSCREPVTIPETWALCHCDAVKTTETLPVCQRMFPRWQNESKNNVTNTCDLSVKGLRFHRWLFSPLFFPFFKFLFIEVLSDMLSAACRAIGGAAQQGGL